MIKRIFDLIISFLLLVAALIPMGIIALIIKIDSKGSVFYKSKRVGRYNKIFIMYKFRTMKVLTPSVATHKLSNPKFYLTKVGKLLRKYSIDEIPQLFNVLSGSMSIVGPRPALYNQFDLINMRSRKKINLLIPGITGWAQINGRDKITIRQKVDLDEIYKKKQNTYFDISIIILTMFSIFKKKDISH